MKKLSFLVKLWIKILLRIVYDCISGGEVCLICGNRSFLYPVCKSCRSKYFVPQLEAPRCSICGKILLSVKNTCSQCREKPVIQSLDRMLPLFSYRLWNKELMFTWKSLEIRSLSSFFASILNKVLSAEKAEFIVPVPPRKGKISEKGWDQIDELCNLLEYVYGFKILRILERHTSQEQKKLDREGRLKQTGNAYCRVCRSKFQKEIKPYGALPQKVWLLDDVCTTGATIENCAHILKEAGIKEITGITLFAVD